MPKIKIAVIDDNKDARELVGSVIEDALVNLEITDQWTVKQSAPFLRLRDYLDWINQENVGVLIIDERLGEIPDASGEAVSYRGSDLVNLVRKQYKDLPIYGVTSFPDDPSLQEHFSLFDEVIRREDFSARAHLYVNRFLRTHKNFLEANEKDLSELSSICKKIALGTASRAEKRRAEAIQTSLEIPVTTMAFSGRKEWTDSYEKIILELKKTQLEVVKFLKKDQKKKK